MNKGRVDFIKKHYITVALVAINVIVWVLLEMGGSTEDGEFMLAHGAMYPYALSDQGEYYRLISAMFLHFGVEHLINNMLILALLGYRLEEFIGHLPMAFIYMFSGICGNYVSYKVMMDSGDFAISSGASGAVFGIIGALIAIVLIRKGKAGDLTLKGLVFMAALSLYYGFTAEGVDNVCHLAGILSGFVIGLIIGKTIDFIRKNQYTKE